MLRTTIRADMLKYSMKPKKTNVDKDMINGSFTKRLTGLGCRELACYSRLPSRMKEAILKDPMNSSSSDSLEFIEPQFIEDNKLALYSHGSIR